ncbi:hypothetical protein Tco_0370770 [Tanacetum coccineum]
MSNHRRSLTFSDGDDDDDDVNEASDAHDDSDENKLDDEGDDFVHPNLSTYTPDDQYEEENVEDEEKAGDDEDMSDQRVHTPPDYQLSEKKRIDAGMIEAHATKDTEDANVNPTAVTPVVQQQSSSASDLVSKFINPSMDEGIDSVLNQNIQSDTLVDIPVTTATETPSSDTTTLQPSTLNIHSLQTPVTTTSTTFPTTTLPEIPNFASLFGFDQRVTALESELSMLKQSNPFAEAISSIPGIVDKYLATKMKEAVDVAVQLKSDKLREEAQAENQDFINSLDSNMTKIIKQQVKAQTSKIMSKLEKYVTDTLGAEVLVRTTKQPQTSYAVASFLSELELKKILMDKMEENKSIDRFEVQKNLYNALVEAYNTDKDIISTYGDVVTISRGHGDEDKDEEPSAGSNRGTKRRRSGKETELTNDHTHKESKTTSSSRGASRSQPTDLDDSTHQEFNTRDDDVTPAREAQDELAGSQPSFDEFMATPIDFYAFMMNRLKIDYLTQELLTGPTYDLMKGTTYPHDLSKPLPLIPNARGRLVIPFDHFINNYLKYPKRGSLSHKYTTSITKIKAADYGQIKWIEDRIPRSMWSTVAVDVYSKHRIIAVISLKIMKFYGYSHLEEITVRRQDDKLYKFREGDFKRLRRQDIEDMLLLLVQGKLTNLSLDERYALNVALRMYTRRIVIQERVEDLQLAVESYQKKINLSRPDSQRSDLRKMTPYTAYPDIQGIIYQDDMNRNRLMRTDELHKFSDGTLNHVHTALNDIAIGIQMEYLPKRRWTNQDKRRARVMINAIDRKLRDRRLMRNLEKFVGGRPYGEDLRLLQRTIRFIILNTSVGNPVKEILLKLNLPDHKSILTDSWGNRTWFSKPKREWGGRGIKEKNVNALNLEVVKDGVLPSVIVAFGNAQMENMGQFMVDKMVEMEKLSSFEDTTILGSFSPLSTSVTTLAVNAPGKSSYANVTSKPSERN